jgi:general nucleoside transport system permease protein
VIPKAELHVHLEGTAPPHLVRRSRAQRPAFNQNVRNGRGYIALAVVFCGRWRPVGALAFALLFGFSSAIAQRPPAFSESGATLFQALPYVLTVIVVAGVTGRSRPPAAVGQPYTRE